MSSRFFKSAHKWFSINDMDSSGRMSPRWFPVLADDDEYDDIMSVQGSHFSPTISLNDWAKAQQKNPKSGLAIISLHYCLMTNRRHTSKLLNNELWDCVKWIDSFVVPQSIAVYIKITRKFVLNDSFFVMFLRLKLATAV